VVRNRAGQETARRIADATRSLLSEGGLEGTTVKAICDAAGVLPGSFYNLYGSKEDVVIEVVTNAIRAADPDPGGARVDTVVDLVDAYVRFVETQPELARIYISVALTGGVTDEHMRARMVRHHQERVTRFADALHRVRPGLDPTACTRTSEALLAALNGYTLHKMLGPSFDLAGHARELLEMEPR